MAAPTFVAKGNFSNTGTNFTPNIPAHVADDIIIVVIETNTAEAPGGPGGSWAEVDVSPQDDGVNGALHVWWIRAVDGSTTGTWVDSGNHNAVHAIVIRGCVTSGSPFSATAGGTHGAGTGISLADLTTQHDDCLIVLCVGTGRDANSALEFSNWTNSNLTSLTERADQIGSGGAGGGNGIATGVKASAGAIGNTTVDIATGTGAGGGHIVLALRPATATTYPQTVAATAIGTGTTEDIITFGVTAPATAVGTGTMLPALIVVLTLAGTVAAVATNVALQVRGAILDATSAVVGTLTTVTTRYLTLAATTAANATTTTVATIGQTLSATAQAIASVAAALYVPQALSTLAGGIADISTRFINAPAAGFGVMLAKLRRRRSKNG